MNWIGWRPWLVLVLGGYLFAHPPVTALAAGGGDWNFSFTPIFWAAGVDIDTTTVKGRSASGEFGSDEILDHLDMGLNFQVEVWRGRWGILIEDLYLNLDLETDFTPRIGPKLDADMDLRLNIFEVAAAHRFDINAMGDTETAVGKRRKGALVLMPMVGFRYGALSQELDLKLSSDRLPGVGERSSTYEDSGWWIEIFTGGRLTYWFANTWAVFLRADVGGFSYQEETVFSWLLFPGLTYRPVNAFSVVAGYKMYDIDYEDDSGDEAFELDAQLHGPLLAITVHF